MLDSLPAPLRGVIASLLLAINTIVCCTPLFVVAIFKLCLPFAAAQRCTDWLMRHIHEAWVSNNKRWMDLLGQTRWQIKGLEGLDYEHSYLVTSNHQSWVDIMVLQYVLNKRIRPLKFFLKQELIWVPVIGLAWWALGFPFMKRYSKAYLAKHPEKKGADLATTRKTCAKFKNQPVGIFNFVEGTRFTEAKHAQQQSPFRYLLKPKAGGVAFVLAAMGEQLDAVLDVTVVYPQQKIPGFWQLISGQVPKVIVDIQTRELDPALWQGDYENDPVFREQVQGWVNQLWTLKDQRISTLRAERG